MDAALQLRVVRGNDQTTGRELNAHAGSGRIPGPIGPLHARGDFSRLRRRLAGVAASITQTVRLSRLVPATMSCL